MIVAYNDKSKTYSLGGLSKNQFKTIVRLIRKRREAVQEVPELKRGEFIMVNDHILADPEAWIVKRFRAISREGIHTLSGSTWQYCVPYADFAPGNMERTRSKVLGVREGALIKINSNNN